MTSEVVKKILNSIKTKEELDILKRGVMLLEQSLYKGKGEGIEEVLHSEFPRDVAGVIREVISGAPYGGSISKTGELFSDLKKEILRIRILGLDLAFYPSEKSVNILSNWVRREIGEGVLLDLNIDRAVIGGASLVFEGKYGDYTLSRMIEEVILDERERILSMVIPQIKEEKV